MIIKQKLIALLPMKGHSERVPNKNMRLFNGYPLYHCIANVLEPSDYVSSVIVNTDSKNIAEDAVRHFSKVHVSERPDNLRGDFVSMNDIIGYDLSWSEGEHYLQTHSTNPLLHAETIDRAIETYFESLDRFDSLFSVTRLQTRLYWGDGFPINHNPKELIRTQDLPPVYEENSNLYIFSKNSFANAGSRRIGLKPMMFEIDKLEAMDIDEPADWEIAEVLYKRRNK